MKRLRNSTHALKSGIALVWLSGINLLEIMSEKEIQRATYRKIENEELTSTAFQLLYEACGSRLKFCRDLIIASQFLTFLSFINVRRRSSDSDIR